jgi:hypothetical protein
MSKQDPESIREIHRYNVPVEQVRKWLAGTDDVTYERIASAEIHNAWTTHQGGFIVIEMEIWTTGKPQPRDGNDMPF